MLFDIMLFEIRSHVSFVHAAFPDDELMHACTIRMAR